MNAVLHFPVAEQYPSRTATVSVFASNLISGISGSFRLITKSRLAGPKSALRSQFYLILPALRNSALLYPFSYGGLSAADSFSRCRLAPEILDDVFWCHSPLIIGTPKMIVNKNYYLFSAHLTS